MTKKCPWCGHERDTPLSLCSRCEAWAVSMRRLRGEEPRVPAITHVGEEPDD